MIKLWDPRNKKSIGTIHEHTSKINTLEFNQNSNLLLSASDDHTCRVRDIRINREFQLFEGHKQKVNCASWHPTQENIFASGSEDGKIMHWFIGSRNAKMEKKHCSNSITCIKWHPLGHMMVTGSSDTSTKFWVRQRPSDGLF